MSLETDAAVTFYKGNDGTALLEAITFGTGADQPGNIKLGLSRRHSLADTKIDSALYGSETAWSLTGDIDGPGSDVEGIPLFTVTPRTGQIYRQVRSTESSAQGSASDLKADDTRLTSQWFGAAFSFWLGQQTSRWTIDLQKTIADDQSLDVTDVDGRRVLTPDRIDGKTYGLSVLHLTTPQFLWRGNIQLATSTNRPDAAIVTLEGRYFLRGINAAVHGQLATYDNLSRPDPVTLTGEIHGKSIVTSWHQKYGERFIIAPFYRWQHETEIPRAENGVTKNTGSDQLAVNIRYRMWNDFWLEDSSELFVTGGVYRGSQSDVGYSDGRRSNPVDLWYLSFGFSSR